MNKKKSILLLLIKSYNTLTHERNGSIFYHEEYYIDLCHSRAIFAHQMYTFVHNKSPAIALLGRFLFQIDRATENIHAIKLDQKYATIE